MLQITSEIFESAGNGNLELLKRLLATNSNSYSSLITENNSEKRTVVTSNKTHNAKEDPATGPSLLLCQLRDKKGSTPLHYAAGNGHIEICRFLLQTVSEQGEGTDSSNYRGNNSCCKINGIAATSSYANIANKTQGRTALHWAARNGHLAVCKLLVEDFGANPDPLAKGDVTPLQLAVWRGHIHVCFWLSTPGTVDKHFVNGWGCTVHHWLAKSPIYVEEQMQQKLEKQKQQVHQSTNPTTINAETKLLTLCKWLDDDDGSGNNNSGYDSNASKRIQSSWNRPNDHGQTPLHKAGFGGNMPVLKFLIETKGCSDNHRDSQHNTAADCAERNRQWGAAKYLRRHGNPRCLQTASAILFPGKKPPPRVPELSQVRASYLTLAKVHHPDRSENTGDSHTQWRILQQAYRLWTLWWEDPEEADAMIRRRERHHFLQRQLPLLILWHEDWHEKERKRIRKDTLVKLEQECGSIGNTNKEEENNESPMQKNSFRNAKKQKVGRGNLAATSAEQGFSEEALQKLEEFERKLVRLLGTLPSNEIPLSQLPKEYEKTWGCNHNTDGKKAMIRPKDYRCKKLGFLLEKYCSRTVKVVQKPNDRASPNVTEEKAKAGTLWVCLI